jgi:hypothetical protein
VRTRRPQYQYLLSISTHTRPFQAVMVVPHVAVVTHNCLRKRLKRLECDLLTKLTNFAEESAPIRALVLKKRPATIRPASWASASPYKLTLRVAGMSKKVRPTENHKSKCTRLPLRRAAPGSPDLGTSPKPLQRPVRVQMHAVACCSCRLTHETAI